MSLEKHVNAHEPDKADIDSSRPLLLLIPPAASCSTASFESAGLSHQRGRVNKAQ